MLPTVVVGRIGLAMSSSPAGAAAEVIMRTKERSMTSRTLLAAILLVATANAAAQEFPTKPIRILVGFAPGGGADIAARFVAQKFTDTWARPAVVDNRPGAGGNVAFELTAKALADGHTLIVAPGPFAPGLYAKLPFDLRKDLVAVTQIARAPMILVVHPS